MYQHRILLVDDHQLFREGLELIVSELSHCEVAGSVSNGLEALDWLKVNSKPDLIVMDLQMQKMDGKETLEAIRNKYKDDLKVIILSMYNNPAIVRRLINVGANGYLLKSADKSEFVMAIQKVLAGANYFSAEITVGLAYKKSDEETLLMDILSEREIEIIKLLAEGLSSREVGEKLFISVRTVETHRKNILSKTGLNNLAALIRVAFVQGLLS